MSPAVAWFWRAVALAIFALVMLAVSWALHRGLDAIPPAIAMAIGFSAFSFSIGFLIGADHGRKQERRPAAPPR